MQVEHHFLLFPQIGDREHLAAESQAHMRDLDGLHDASEFDLLVAPIKLADLARRKIQRNKALGHGWAEFGRLPTSNEPPGECPVNGAERTISDSFDSLNLTRTGNSPMALARLLFKGKADAPMR